MTKLITVIALAAAIIGLSSCAKDKEKPMTTGSTMHGSSYGK